MEPECCYVDSPIAAEHPEWILRSKGKDDGRFDRRHVLNFALPEVKKYIFDKTCYLIDNCGVDYFKIDFNRLLQDVGTEEMDIFIFGRGIGAMRIYERLRLDGLEEDAKYSFEEIDGIEQSEISVGNNPQVNTPIQKTMTGKALMRLGIDFVLRGDMDSIVYHFRKEEN